MPDKRPFEEKIKELLICSLCQDVFDNPRQLLCGHSFCIACIRNLATSMQYEPFFKCPICRFAFGPIMHTFITLALNNIVEFFNNVSEGRSHWLRNQLRGLLTCSVCHSIFDDPRQLRCGHSFCKTCLKNQSDLQGGNQVFSCPDCRTIFPRVHLFKTFSLNSIVDNFKCAPEQRQTMHLPTRGITENARVPVAIPTRDRSEDEAESRSKQLRTLQMRAEILRLLMQRELHRQRQTVHLPTRGITDNARVSVATPTIDRSEVRQQKKADSRLFVTVSLILLLVAIYFSFGRASETKSNQDTHQNKQHQFGTEQGYDKSNSALDTKFPRKPLQFRLRTNFLDVTSASPFLMVTKDQQSAIRLSRRLPYPSHPSRFYSAPQVMTTNCAYFGSNFWIVDLQGYWDVGVAYPSISRNGKSSALGINSVSWSLSHKLGVLSAYYNKKKIKVQMSPGNEDVQRIVVSVNFDSGVILFAEVGNKLNFLYAFKAVLTQPVCLAVGLYSVDPPSSVSIVKSVHQDFGF